MLHVGAMKTGTTFLQQLLADHREALADEGFAVPRYQARALRGILSGTPSADSSERRHRLARELSRQVQEHDGRATIVSWEFLSFLDAARARQVLAAFPGVRVDVVLTVRDTARTMPAQWQTTCRNGTTLPWPRFARGVGAWLDRGRDSKSARVFRRAQGVPDMLDVWTAAVGREHVHVVTVPRAGADPVQLWRRFAGVCGIDPALSVDPGVRRNPSLGHPSCELLRRVNVLFDGDLPYDCAQVVRAVVAPDLEGRATEEPAVRLDARGREVAAAWNHMVRDAITAAGVTVHGDLDDLPIDLPEAVDDVHEPLPEELLAAAATARTGLAGLGATPLPEPPTEVDAAVEEIAVMIREVAGSDLTAARRARGRGRG